jgi:hypothetical protein
VVSDSGNTPRVKTSNVSTCVAVAVLMTNLKRDFAVVIFSGSPEASDLNACRNLGKP